MPLKGIMHFMREVLIALLLISGWCNVHIIVTAIMTIVYEPSVKPQITTNSSPLTHRCR